MSSPTEKNSDQNGCKCRCTQGLSDINLISLLKPQPLPLTAPQPVPLLPLVKTNSSSTSLSDEFSGLTTEEQDLQLAKNLILLSQGGNLIDQAAAKQSSGTPTSQSQQPPSIEMEKVSAVIKIQIERHDTLVPSRQPVESTAPTTDRDYMCKNCNKRFNSSQALGGHCASHKKLKVELDEPKVQSSTDTGRTSSSMVLKLDDINNIQNEIQVNPPAVRPPVHTADNKARLHPCKECPAVFNSGQALGGHMRKHRPLNKDGDASKNKKAKVATQEPPVDVLDRTAIQQQPNGNLDRAAIQQSGNDGLNGGLDRIGIVQQQVNGGLNLDLNLPTDPDQDDTMQQPPAVQPHDADPESPILLFGKVIKLSRD